MADSATPLDALRLLIEEEIEKVPYRPYVMVGNLLKEDEFQSQCEWNANTGGATVTGRATTEDAVVGDKSETNKAILPIGNRVLGHPFSVIRNDIVQARRAGQGALQNLFRYHVTEGFDVIFEELNKQLYVGDGSNASHQIYGLEYVTDSTNNYAGIDNTTYTEWVSSVDENGGTGRNLTKALMDGLDVALTRRGVMYNAIYTTPELIKRYENLFNTERSLTVNQFQGVADVGFSGHSYNGVPIVKDIHCPDNTMYFIDTRKIVLKTYNLGGAARITDSTGKVLGVQADATKTNNLNFLISELPSNNPHAVKFEISIQPQLRVRQPKSVAKLADINQ